MSLLKVVGLLDILNGIILNLYSLFGVKKDVKFLFCFFIGIC